MLLLKLPLSLQLQSLLLLRKHLCICSGQGRLLGPKDLRDV